MINCNANSILLINAAFLLNAGKTVTILIRLASEECLFAVTINLQILQTKTNP